MKLGIIAGWKENDFKMAKRHGLSFLEFCVNVGINVAEVFTPCIPDIKANMEKYGVGVGSIGRWASYRIKEDGTISDEEFKADCLLIDACVELGSPVFVCGCNPVRGKTREEMYEIAVAYFTKLVEYASPKGIKVAICNCSWNNCIHQPRDWAYVLPRVPGLSLKYDASHAKNEGRDFMAEIRDWGDKFAHFHIKGNLTINGSVYDEPPAGLDTFNWGAIIGMLYTKNYNGGLSIEPHSRYWLNNKVGDWGISVTVKTITPFIMPEDYSME